MSEFRGLHNPERHKGNQPDTRCVRCHGGYEVCAPDAPCYCCLAAEVESLREERDALKHDYDKVAAQVQAVRDACDAAFPINDIGTRVVTLSAILYALDGGDA